MSMPSRRPPPEGAATSKLIKRLILLGKDENMPRVKYENKKYLNAQRAAMLHAQYELGVEPKEMRQALGVSYTMYRNYMTGICPLPHDLLFLKRIDSELVTRFVDIYQRHLWGL